MILQLKTYTGDFSLQGNGQKLGFDMITDDYRLNHFLTKMCFIGIGYFICDSILCIRMCLCVVGVLSDQTPRRRRKMCQDVR